MDSEVKPTKLEARYQFQSLIGTGGAGDVYAAWDDQLKRTVAIKRIKPNGLDDATLANPWNEAIRLAAIRHSNIVTIYDMGHDNDIPYMVMEHVQGETIDQRIAANGPFSELEFADLARQSLDGLLAAHHAGLIHRDLKPANIMLSPLPSGSFRVKILDFGMAKFMEVPSAQTMNIDGSITGSISWISPEQLNRKVVDERSDLYSIGCVFYYALSGKEPFYGDNSVEITAAHLSHNVVPLETLRSDMQPLLAQWVMALINLEPEHRYQNAMQALGALNSIMGYTQSLAQPVSAPTTIITPAVPLPTADNSEAKSPSAPPSQVPLPRQHPTRRERRHLPTQKSPEVASSSTSSSNTSLFWKFSAAFLVLTLIGGMGWFFTLRKPAPVVASTVSAPVEAVASGPKLREHYPFAGDATDALGNANLTHVGSGVSFPTRGGPIGGGGYLHFSSGYLLASLSAGSKFSMLGDYGAGFKPSSLSLWVRQTAAEQQHQTRQGSAASLFGLATTSTLDTTWNTGIIVQTRERKKATDVPILDLQLRVRNGGSGTSDAGELDTKVNVSNGAWHHVAITFTGTNRYAYVDGTYAGANNVAVPFTTNPLANFTVGCFLRSGTSLDQWTGDIADLQVYDGAFSKTDIARLLKSPGKTLNH